MTIKHLNHSKIDIERWNFCIENALNSLPYAKSYYLDIVSPEWEALVYDEYQAVMPLPKRRKWGMPYFTQPPFTQQLGIFSRYPTDEQIINKFISKIPRLPYRLNINYANYTDKSCPMANYVLPLNKDYNEIAKKFSVNTVRNIKKGHKAGVVVRRYLSDNRNMILKSFLSFYFSTPKPYISPDVNLVSKLISECFLRGDMVIYFAYNKTEDPIAALALLTDSNRLINILPVSNMEGKRLSAMFIIIQQIISEYQNSCYLLDFEGSRIDGVADFYRGFGAILQAYYQINRFIFN